jgi:uncharacterized membrane protein
MSKLTFLTMLILRYYFDERHDSYRVTSVRLTDNCRVAYIHVTTGQMWGIAYTALYWAMTDFLTLTAVEHIKTLRSGRELFECVVILGY